MNVSRLIFRWPEHRSSLLLPVFFLFALAAHGLAFYLFQVVYPPTATMAPPPAHVTLLAPTTPENRALLSWMENQGPLPTLQPAEPPLSVTIGYIPTYENATPFPDPLPEGQAPAPIAPKSLWQAAATASAPAPVRAPIPSILKLSETLLPRASRLPREVPIPSGGNLPPTIYLVGIDARGEVALLYLQSGSGDVALDQKAAAHLRENRFDASPGPIIWGFVTFLWSGETKAEGGASS